MSGKLKLEIVLTVLMLILFVMLNLISTGNCLKVTNANMPDPNELKREIKAVGEEMYGMELDMYEQQYILEEAQKEIEK